MGAAGTRSSRAEAPPEAWAYAHGLARSAVAPVERFLRTESAAGIVLLAAAALALVLANSPWAAAVERFWSAELSLGVGPWSATGSLHFVVNEGVMTLFFFVMGIEVRREVQLGELSRWRTAALPAVAALGGMIVPAGIFFALNRSGEAARAWGLPMATDIAFAVGVLTLLGKRVPGPLRVLLLALAIVDDIGAILVIAFVFSEGVHFSGAAVAAAGVLVILILQRLGARRTSLYVLPGIVVWAGTLKAGVQPTVAGVALGLLTPVRPWPAGGETRSPGERLQSALHPWVSFLVIPVFALANAGVSVRGLELGDPRVPPLSLGVMAGLVLGKPLGIVLASLAAVKLGVAALPRRVTWRGVIVVGLAGGIGFTMALYIAELALASPELLAAAKLAVLVSSALAAVTALAYGRTALD
jgi:NhaA family Na+:H+ antiporter